MVRLSGELATVGARLAEVSGILGLLDRLGSGSASQIHVLVYHRVARTADDPSLCPELVSATPEAFASQMEWLRERHAVVSIDELIEAVQGERQLPPRSVLITFDDAYADFADNAWPALERLGLPATMFVPTAFPGDQNPEFWWERLHRAVRSAPDPTALLACADLPAQHDVKRLAIYRQLRDRTKALPHAEAMTLVEALCEQAGTRARVRTVLDWDELRALAQRGLTLCAHTRTHPMLDRVDNEEVRAELSGSLDDLRREIGEVTPAFAYPGGAYDQSVVRTTEELGFRVGFTTRRGVADLAHDHPLELPRIPVSQSVTLPIFRAQLLSQFASLNGLWK